MWLQELSPSDELLNFYNDGLLDWDAYVRRFTREVLTNPEKLPFLLTLKKMTSEGVVTLLCHEETDERCHRRLLIEKVENLMQRDRISPKPVDERTEKWKEYLRLLEVRLSALRSKHPEYFAISFGKANDAIAESALTGREIVLSPDVKSQLRETWAGIESRG
jgi:hypothetical protein